MSKQDGFHPSQNLQNFSDDQLKSELERRSSYLEIQALKVDNNYLPPKFTFTAPIKPNDDFSIESSDDTGSFQVIKQDDMRRLSEWIQYKLDKLKPSNSAINRELAERGQ